MLASQSADRRMVSRKKDAARRAKHEERYRATFRQAVLDYLDLDPKYAALAGRIADAVVFTMASGLCRLRESAFARTQSAPSAWRVLQAFQ
jgi:hypothetical protein